MFPHSKFIETSKTQIREFFTSRKAVVVPQDLCNVVNLMLQSTQNNGWLVITCYYTAQKLTNEGDLNFCVWDERPGYRHSMRLCCVHC